MENDSQVRRYKRNALQTILKITQEWVYYLIMVKLINIIIDCFEYLSFCLDML